MQDYPGIVKENWAVCDKYMEPEPSQSAYYEQIYTMRQAILWPSNSMDNIGLVRVHWVIYWEGWKWKYQTCSMHGF